MSKTSKTVLAFGASGKFAGLVVPELVRRGARVRGWVHRPEQADEARRQGAEETVVADLQNPSALKEALLGVDTVFYIAPAFMPGEPEAGVRVVELAKAAGVRRFVFSSVIHPSLSLVNHAGKAPVEAAILGSGMEYAILQPAVYFQNLRSSWARVVETGVLSEPWTAETRFSRVDYRDVAEVAALALTDDRLLNGTFELCADGWLNRHDLAKQIGQVLGRPIKAAKSQGSAATNSNSSNPQAAALKAMVEWYDHHDLLGNALVLRTILGREPRTLLAFFEELGSAHRPVN